MHKEERKSMKAGKISTQKLDWAAIAKINLLYVISVVLGASK
jgi:hypothetical protein